jgi:SAM-dependent methyltransferase
MTTVVPEHVGGDITAQLELLRRDHPRFYACLDQNLTELWRRDLLRAGGWHDDFGPDGGGGRGDHYLAAQTANAMARADGIGRLLRLLRDGGGDQDRVVLDLLGGDGLLRRVAALLGIDGIDILTCDLSPHMVGAAWAAGAPAVLQRADRLLCRSGSVDGVLLAYGTHHIPPEDRLTAVEESFRVLRPGGLFVLHDFEAGGAMDGWFSQVVDAYSATGHEFAHFTRDELAGYLAKAGFTDSEIVEIDDPYRAGGDTAEAAELAIGQYLVNMYGLVKVEESLGADGAARWALARARQIFGHGHPDAASPRQDPETGTWQVTVHRTALVGIAHRP